MCAGKPTLDDCQASDTSGWITFETKYLHRGLEMWPTYHHAQLLIVLTNMKLQLSRSHFANDQAMIQCRRRRLITDIGLFLKWKPTGSVSLYVPANANSMCRLDCWSEHAHSSKTANRPVVSFLGRNILRLDQWKKVSIDILKVSCSKFFVRQFKDTR